MPDLVNGQTDFGAGIYRGREAPENAVYDAVNLMVDDEGQLFRRGGTGYRSTANAGTTLLGLADAYTAAGRRTITWGPAGANFYVLDAAGAPVTIPRQSTGAVVPPDNPIRPMARAAASAGHLILPATGPDLGQLMVYAGSLKTANYGALSVALPAGSATVTGAGTVFLANVDAGMIFVNYTEGVHIPVESVQSNTSLTLTRASSVELPPASTGYFYAKTALNAPGIAPGPIYAAAVANRVTIATGTRVYFSDPFDVFTGGTLSGGADQYHELPSDAVIFGAASIRDTLILFTATGVWAISQMDFDPIDDMGNIQHQVQQINKDLILWGDAGISSFAGALVVPGLEDIVLLDAGGGVQAISQAIRPLYRSYVKAGYQPGVSVVHRGHYFLPVLNGTTLVDVLVCRVDRGTAWTRWSGHAASTSYAQRVGDPSRAPALLGIKGERVTDLSSCFDPSAANPSDADATTHPIAVETRDYITPGRRTGSTTETLRLRYEATAAGTPALTAEFSRYQEGAAYTSLNLLIGGAASDGSGEAVWRVGKRAPSIRFRVASSSALSTFKLRSLEAPWRRST